MSKPNNKMQSWQVFHFARKHLGNSVLYAIFGKKKARAIDTWAQDPRYTQKQEGSYDPVLGVKTLLETLDDYGHTDVVRQAVNYMTANTSAAADCDPPLIQDLQPTISDEILCDYKAVAEMQAAIEAGESVVYVSALKDEAIDEIARTVALYRKQQKIF